MKRIVLPIFLIIISITICNGQDYKSFENLEHGFSIEYPTDWNLVENHQVTVQHEVVTVPFVAVSPITAKESMPASINVITTFTDMFENNKQYLNYNLMSINESFPGIKINKTKAITINGLEGYLISYVLNSNIKIEQYIFLKDNRGICITTAVVKNKYWKVKKAFKKMVGTFKVFTPVTPEEEGF